MSVLGSNILELRKEKGWTQKNLAVKINTTEDSIYSWEKGRAEPSVDFIIKLAEVFGVTTDYLFGLAEY